MHDYIPTAIGLPAAALACLWLWWLERRDLQRPSNPIPPTTGPRGTAGDSGASNV